MAEEKLSEGHCNVARNALRLTSGALVFELSEHETNYRPDDWAWAFLRLSNTYKNAYKAHASDDDVDLSHALDCHQIPGLKPDLDGTCATNFGLPAWIPPSAEELPRLKDVSDSWFFPLKRPIAEDYRRTSVLDVHYHRIWTPYSAHLDKYAHILANEGLFGYRKPPAVPAAGRRPKESTLGLVWVAIDCSIPPDGQISALADLALTMRGALMGEGWKTRRSDRNVDIQQVENSDAFGHMNFMYAARTTDNVSDYKTVWRAVMIDSLAPIGIQKKKLLSDLRGIHRELIAKRLVQEPRSLRFKKAISASYLDHHGKRQLSSGGNYLKALLVLAQLSHQGYTDPAEVAQITGIRTKSGLYIERWALHFEENLDQHIKDAQQMINGGYRLLIHGQDPSN